ncbi:MAG: M48 family metallopeptidase [Boseongicola sp. SB0664_bin_43]|uniref:M48 family metallopeptidase n=1 Tax=Boseongicola sp. SB0664_bin_43 TaxID=2604844 RepID=A0A6B0XYN3_9RHOB|nr:M48 family metallopeptidase [Boseongicola sp. SB0664_bin_43]MYK31653.1 M48 family metallopeptidase [Boseongicola sp. SB0670_bin_30]
MRCMRLDSVPGVRIDVRQSARARRLSLRVSNLDGRVTLTLPTGVSLRVAQDFAAKKANWIARAVERRPCPIPVDFGAEIPVEGKPHMIVRGSGSTARFAEGAIEAPEGPAAPAVMALLKELARERLVAAAERHSRAVGKEFRQLTLKDTRSRWGSCSAEGNLMFSWRLIMSPPGVLDYVAAHEVAHLRHMDHSSAFWSVVRTVCPEYQASRGWLRREGAGLHRYRFSSGD